MAGAVQAAAHLCCSSFQVGIAPLELQQVQISLARTRVKLAALSLSGRLMGPMLWLLLMQLLLWLLHLLGLLLLLLLL